MLRRDYHFVDFSDDLRCQAFAEVGHHRQIKRRLAVVKGFEAAEVLEIRILLDLKCNLCVGETVLRLNDSRTETKAQ